ncbi:MAG TPA: winged helix-turn-helix transcriptional regulator [Methanocella sp.]|jgi:predicted transcriptional regulator
MKNRVLAGIAILALIVAAVVFFFVMTGGSATSDRELPGMGNPDYMLTGSDDTLYLFSGDNITAVASDGSLKYRYVVPDGWMICPRWYIGSRQGYVDSITNDIYRGSQIVCADNGTLYLYLKPEDSASDLEWDENTSVGYYRTGKLVAIGPDGRQRWSADLTSFMLWLNQWYQDSLSWAPSATSDAYIQARGDRVYVFHGYNESVYASNGTLLWSIENVSDPGTVDDAGNLYVLDAIQPLPIDATPRVSLNIPDNYVTLAMPDYRVPGSIVDSYYPNGTLRWRQYSADRALRQNFYGDGPVQLPLLRNSTVYVISDTSVTAIDTDGNKQWVKRFDRNDYPFLLSDSQLADYYPPSVIPSDAFQGGNFQAYWFMPFDAEGNLCIIYPLYNKDTNGRWFIDSAAYIIVITPDGTVLSSQKVKSWDYTVVGNDIGYSSVFEYSAGLFGSGRSLDDLYTGTLCASAPGTGEPLWNFTVPTDRRITLVVNESNYNKLIPSSQADLLANMYNWTRNWGDLTSTIQPTGGVYGGVQSFGVHPGNGVVYVDFQTHNYEYPFVFNQSRYVYSGGVYALDNNGTLLWYVPMAPDTDVISASNSTIIYNTWDGKTYAKALGTIAGGVALISGAYLAFYFFAGTVTRARNRLDKNGNRTEIFRYVQENPGTTLYEIARGTGINRGTVRYHLFILGTNHRIVAHEAGEKFVRYFTNAGSYGDRERRIISLLRRDVTGKVLRLIAEQPGIASVDLARELDIHESVAHRSIKELLDKGILLREAAGRGYTYMLTASDRALVIRCMEKIAGHASL